MAIMNECTPSKNVLATVFFNFFYLHNDDLIVIR